MLTLQPQGKIIERIVRTKTGMLVRARFFVTTIEGQVSIKLLAVMPIRAIAAVKRAVLCLVGGVATGTVPARLMAIGTSITSPFLRLSFFISQPTRAPSLR